MMILNLLKELVQIDSQNPPGNEKTIAYFIKDFLQELKLDVELQRFGPKRYNLVCCLGKGKNGLMVCGHLDTVPIGRKDEWKFDPWGELVGNKLYGRGTVDMKGGIACLLIALKNILQKGRRFRRKLVVCLVGDEEVGLRGSTYLIEKRKDIFENVKYGILAEPTNFNLIFAQKGIAGLRIRFKGKAAHGSKPKLGVNAIYEACDFIRELRKREKALKKKKDRDLGPGTINVGKISGGTKVNMVPDFCEVEIDRRLIPGESLKVAISEVREILRSLKLKADIEVMVSRPPLKLQKKF